MTSEGRHVRVVEVGRRKSKEWAAQEGRRGRVMSFGRRNASVGPGEMMGWRGLLSKERAGVRQLWEQNSATGAHPLPHPHTSSRTVTPTRQSDMSFVSTV
jgi:hypothetical protein